MIDPDLIPEGAMQVDGFNDCIIGVAQRFGDQDVLAYDINKILVRLAQDGMTLEEAEEYFDYNIAGAWVGEGTPVFIRTIL